MKNKKRAVTLNITLTAIFAALCCAATMISVPLPFGYFNLGDVIVLSAAWLLGPLYGAIAAGIGSSLADVLLSFVSYAPATFVIKALMAVAAYALFSVVSKIIKGKKSDVLSSGISAIAAEIIMVAGYFLFEAFVMGYGASGALASIPGNCLQGAVGIVGSTLLFSILIRSRNIRELFGADRNTLGE